jgi:hypothetical protein
VGGAVVTNLDVDGALSPIEKRYFEATVSGIRSVVDAFRTAPASFLFEAELQGLLFARLFQDLSELAIPWTPSHAHWATVANGRALHVNPAKAEYPAGTRFDVALLAPNMEPGRKAWNHNVRLAIEIKFRQADGTGRGFADDEIKLREYAKLCHEAGRRFTGICLVFCHLCDDRSLLEWRDAGRIEVNPEVLSPPHDGFAAWAFTP